MIQKFWGVMKTRRGRLIYAAAILGFAFLAGYVIFHRVASDPRYYSKRTWHVPASELLAEELVRAEDKRVGTEMEALRASGVWNPTKLMELQRRSMRTGKYYNQLPSSRYARGFQVMRYVGTRDDYVRVIAPCKVRLRDIFEADPEYMRLESLKAFTDESNGGAVFLHYLLRYMMTIPIGLVIFVLLMVRDGSRPLGALVEACSYRWCLLFYPFTALFYGLDGLHNYGRYEEQLRRAARFVGYATAVAVSVFCGGGIALAQAVKKSAEKKPKGISLQLDTRLIAPISGLPPTGFNRTTLTSRHFLVQAISTVTPTTGSWYNESGGGVKLIGTAQTSLFADAYLVNASGGIKRVTVGAEYFRSGAMVVIAVPAMRIEKTLGGPTALFLATNPFFRLAREGLRSRLALAPDVTYRKTFGKPRVWSAGLGFGFFHRKGKGDRAEVAVLRNSTGFWQLRGRYIHNFAF